MADDMKAIYGDGILTVTASPRHVTLTQVKGRDVQFIHVSRAAFREVMLGMERYQQQESED